jgi:hypothetical protein
MNAWKHFKTITKHRWQVRKHCFRVGLYWRGLVHDLSKYSWAEFRSGIKYYQGTRSPNSREREVLGYSVAWMHHKGRNRHHFEYWTDLNLQSRRYEPVEMPRVFLVEMVMDRIAACKIYNGASYTDSDPLNYFLRSSESRQGSLMHENTKRDLCILLTMLRDKGEKETFRYIKDVVLKNLPIKNAEP